MVIKAKKESIHEDIPFYRIIIPETIHLLRFLRSFFISEETISKNLDIPAFSAGIKMMSGGN